MDNGLEGATRRWVAGWARARGVGTGVVAGWPIVHVRAASRAFELVCAEPDTDAWETLLDDIAGDRTAMLTLVSARPEHYLKTLPHGVRVDRDDEVLMVTDTFPTATRADLTAYDVEHELADDRVGVRLTVDHTVAAEGTGPAEPELLLPVTVTTIVEPTSAVTSVYVEEAAPRIGLQFAPPVSQRNH